MFIFQQSIYIRATLLSKMLFSHFNNYDDIFDYNDVIISTMASQITSLTILYWTIYSGADKKKHQNFALLAFVWVFHWWPVNSPHKGPVTRKMFPFDDVIMSLGAVQNYTDIWSLSRGKTKTMLETRIVWETKMTIRQTSIWHKKKISAFVGLWYHFLSQTASHTLNISFVNSSTNSK